MNAMFGGKTTHNAARRRRKKGVSFRLPAYKVDHLHRPVGLRAGASICRDHYVITTWYGLSRSASVTALHTHNGCRSYFFRKASKGGPFKLVPSAQRSQLSKRSGQHILTTSPTKLHPAIQERVLDIPIQPSSPANRDPASSSVRDQPLHPTA